MKRFLINIFLFSALITALIFLINAFQTKFNNEPPHYKLQYSEAVNNASQYNGIIIGNSQATHAIRPSYLDYSNVRYYNLALNASSPSFYLKWFDHLFINNHSKIDYLIISTSFSFLWDGGWRKFEQDAEFLPRKDLLKMCREDNRLDKKMLLQNRWPFLKYRTRVLKSFQKNWGSYEFLIKEYDRGYITLRKNAFVDFNNPNRFKIELSSKAKNNFNKLLDKISGLGVKIIFVIPPEYKMNIDRYVGFKEFLLNVSKKRNIPLYDFNDEKYREKLDTVENFVDLYHLSGKGSSEYSSILGEAIYPTMN